MKELRKLIFGFLAIVGTWGCDKDDPLQKSAYTPIESGLTVEVMETNTGEVGGDGVKLLIITGGSIPTPNVVSLIIEGRGFFPNGKKKIGVNVSKNDTLTIAVSSDTIGTALVTASLLNITKTLSIGFEERIAQFDFYIVEDSVQADNSSEASVRVRVKDADLLRSNQAVSFATSSGTFSNGQQQIDRSLGSDSVASAYIKKGTAGRAIVTASIGGVSRIVELVFLPVKVNQGFTFKVLNNGVPADGVSEVMLEVKPFSPDVSNPLQVQFQSTQGVFSNNSDQITVPVSLDSTARAYLRHSNVGNVAVTATYANQSRQVQVNFQIAWPDNISVVPGTAVVPNVTGANLQIEGRLNKNVGTVSPGIPVIWYDSTATGVSPGIFLNQAPASSSGISMAQYHIQDTSFVGDIFLKARVNTATGVVRGFNKIVVTK